MHPVNTRMLPNRSVFLQVCLLLSITKCHCQEYESDYGVQESGENYESDGGHPDYSKYYSVDTSAPFTQSQGNDGNIGFAGPIEFAGFFSPIEFGASQKQEVAAVKNPFVKDESRTLGFVDNKQAFPEFYSGSNSYPKDYFEESQKAQQSENKEERVDGFDVIPGPNYISHQVPAQSVENEEIETITRKPIKTTRPKKTKDHDYNEKPSGQFKNPDYLYDHESGTPNKYADYNTGKSSSTVSQYPQAPGRHQLKPISSSSPYEKYSFQPVTDGDGLQSKYLGSLISTIAPFNPAYTKLSTTAATPLFEAQSSENIPSNLKGKNCRRVRKHIGNGESGGRSKREAMNCFVCEDPGSSSKYTQCSYATESEPIDDYAGTSERYSTPSREPDGFRYKRYSGDEYSNDPYEYVKSKSLGSYTKPKKDRLEKTEEADETEETEDFEEYPYAYPEYYSEEPDKSFSELQSEQLQKNAGNCIKEEKKGMTCTICKDSKTGGNFEQCSYTSDPKEQKYAYVTEKKYDSLDQPEEGSESKPVGQTKEAQNKDSIQSERIESAPIDQEPKLKESNKDKYEKYNPAKEFHHHNDQSSKLVDDQPYEIPKHFVESTQNNQNAGPRGLDPALYGNEDSAETNEESEGTEETEESQSTPQKSKLENKEIDEYHFKLFPEFSHQESQQDEVRANDPSTETTRKDVEEVLAEFSKKDRSTCKKAEKNGMTCYLCVDSKGIQHEECMYVSESKPQASHRAYHEVKQIKSPETDHVELHPAASINSDIKRKHFFKKVTTPLPFTLDEAASEEVETKIKYKPTKSRKRYPKKSRKEPKTSASNRDVSSKLSDENEPTLRTPVEFAVGDKEGAYSAETRPVYSKTLGVKLPKYMIEKSEFEKEFDEFAGRD